MGVKLSVSCFSILCRFNSVVGEKCILRKVHTDKGGAQYDSGDHLTNDGGLPDFRANPPEYPGHNNDCDDLGQQYGQTCTLRVQKKPDYFAQLHGCTYICSQIAA